MNELHNMKKFLGEKIMIPQSMPAVLFILNINPPWGRKHQRSGIHDFKSSFILASSTSMHGAKKIAAPLGEKLSKKGHFSYMM